MKYNKLIIAILSLGLIFSENVRAVIPQFDKLSPVQKKQFLQRCLRFSQIGANNYMKKHPYRTTLGLYALNSGVGMGMYAGSYITHKMIANQLTEKLVNSTERGITYTNHYNNPAAHLTINDLRDDYFKTAALRQTCYVPVDMIVSEGLDKIAELESTKMIADKISEEKRVWFKNQLTVATSAATINVIEELTKENSSKTFNKPFQSLVANHLVVEGIDDFIIQPYVVKPLGNGKFVKLTVALAYGHYILPYIAQTIKTVFG